MSTGGQSDLLRPVKHDHEKECVMKRTFLLAVLSLSMISLAACVSRGEDGAAADAQEPSRREFFALDMAEKTGGALDPTIYPVVAAWGFTTMKTGFPVTRN